MMVQPLIHRFQKRCGGSGVLKNMRTRCAVAYAAHFTRLQLHSHQRHVDTRASPFKRPASCRVVQELPCRIMP